MSVTPPVGHTKYWLASSAPATPASDAPMPKVIAIIRSAGMPIACAISRSWVVARSLRPIWVRLKTTNCSAIRTDGDQHDADRLLADLDRPPSRTSDDEKSGGPALASGPNTTTNRFCRNMPHNSVLMNTVAGGRRISGKVGDEREHEPDEEHDDGDGDQNERSGARSLTGATTAA